MPNSSRHELRDYQERAVQCVIDALDRRPLLVAPTGSGKSSMGSAVVERVNRPTLWLAHRKELIEQAAARLVTHDQPVGIIMAGYQPTRSARVQVASLQTLVRREQPPAALIVIDEAHRVAAQSYTSVLAAYPDAAVVGLTATPFRLDGRGLGNVFGELVVAALTDELCDAGVLCRPKVYASEGPDLHGLRVIAGDYSLDGLAQRTNTAAQNADIIRTWQRHAAGKRTVAFAVDIAHSLAIVAAFRAAGVTAEHLDGDVSASARTAILERLRIGTTLVVSNCMVLTEGWDLPALECAIIARPTASLNLHIQMIGRVMRAREGKAGAIVLDHAGNHHAHGPVTRRIAYSLSNERVRHTEPLNLRRCGACCLLFELTAAACPDCGWEVPVPQEREAPPITGKGELVAFDDRCVDYRQEAWEAIEAERIARGFKPAWSEFRFFNRFGDWPAVLDGILVDPHRATQEEKREVYAKFVATARERGFKPGWASWKYRGTFGVWPRGFVAEVRTEAA